MARPLLSGRWRKFGALFGGVLLLGGCLLPQDDTLLDPLPRKNRPPRILEQNVQPAQHVTVATNCGTEFSAFVEDPDIDDKLTYRWYVDYDPTVNSPTRAPFEEGQLQNNGQPVRSSSATWTADTGSTRTPLSEVGPHLVTLMVFDGTLGVFDGPGSIPPPDPVEGVDAGNPHYSDSYSWAVDISPTADCPTP